MITKLRNSFFAGLVTILPIILTVLILRFFIVKIDSGILKPITDSLKVFLEEIVQKQPLNLTLLTVAARVIIFIALLGLVTLLGFMTRIIIFRRIISYGEVMLTRLPLVSKIYSTIREISSAFLGREKSVFQKVVLIEYPRRGVYSIGFVTRPSSGEIQASLKDRLLNVFIPTTPNPTSGVLLMVPEKDIINLNMTVEQGLKLVVSGGAVVPPYKIPQKDDGHKES